VLRAVGAAAGEAPSALRVRGASPSADDGNVGGGPGCKKLCKETALPVGEGGTLSSGPPSVSASADNSRRGGSGRETSSEAGSRRRRAGRGGVADRAGPETRDGERPDEPRADERADERDDNAGEAGAGVDAGNERPTGGVGGRGGGPTRAETRADRLASVGGGTGGMTRLPVDVTADRAGERVAVAGARGACGERSVTAASEVRADSAETVDPDAGAILPAAPSVSGAVS